MEKIETNDLLQIIGMLGLIASLIFVGMELRQNQQVARVTAYQALAEQIASYNSQYLGCYSWRNASIGSRRAARRAGTYPNTTPTRAENAKAPITIFGSIVKSKPIYTAPA